MEKVSYEVNENIVIELENVNTEDIRDVYRYTSKNVITGVLKPEDFLRYSEEPQVIIRNRRNAKLFERPRPGHYAASFFISDSIENLELIRQEFNRSFGNKSIAQGNLICKGYNKISTTEYTIRITDKPKIIVPSTFHLDHWKFKQINYADYVSCFKIVRE